MRRSFRRHQRPGFGAAMLRSARRLIVMLCLAGIIWLGGLIWFAEGIPREGTPLPTQTTDAVVVLTGGPARLKAGLAELEAGRARKLFVSGVNPLVELGELLRAAGDTGKVPESAIALGYSADSTVGNASETRQWMDREGFRSLRLVTASYHMRRSLLEFHRAMPGTEIIAHPVFPETFMRDSWWSWPGTLALIVNEYHKYVAVRLRDLITSTAGS